MRNHSYFFTNILYILITISILLFKHSISFKKLLNGHNLSPVIFNQCNFTIAALIFHQETKGTRA